jgi:hypothetical protein
MKSSTRLFALSFVSMLLAADAAAGVKVRVTVLGQVGSNAINQPPLSLGTSGSPAKLTFLLDSAQFQDSGSFPTRGYVIDQGSFQLTVGTGVVSIQSPFPPGQTPYFVLRNNDPAVDGFFISRDVDGPNGIPLSQNGNFGAFLAQFLVTYGGTTLNSLDLLGALGTYDFTGLSVYNWTVDDGPFNPMILDFARMTIACEPTAPVIYCQGKQNSQGCVPSIGTDAGAPSFSGGAWNVNVANLINQKNGLFIWSQAGPDSAPFFGGTLCLAQPLTRTAVQNSGGNAGPDDCSGTMSVDLVGELTGQVTPPVVVWVQAWSRDPSDPFTVGLSNAVAVQACP